MPVKRRLRNVGWRRHLLKDMNALETGTLPDLRAQVHEGTKRVRKKIQETLEEWFQICDHILDVHRSRFLFREPTPAELEEHKIAVSECIETCNSRAVQLTEEAVGWVTEQSCGLTTLPLPRCGGEGRGEEETKANRHVPVDPLTLTLSPSEGERENIP